MHDVISPQQLLNSWARDDEHRKAISGTVERLVDAATSISRLVQRSAYAASNVTVINGSSEADESTFLALSVNRILLDALKDSPVAALAFSDSQDLLRLAPGERLAVTVDPLNGSSDLHANAPVGTIFSIWPASKKPFAPKTGSRQLAAGFAIYGPRTAFVMSVGQSVQIFTLDPQTLQFSLTCPMARVPESTREYAINAAHHRYWDNAICEYVNDCLNGDRHPASDFDMRWSGSLVAEAFRVLVRGGICLYPHDARPGCEQAPLRLVFEANPVALLMEQAGGAATDGASRVLRKPISSLRERAALVFGSAGEVERVRRHHTDLCPDYESSPLFTHRGLFQRQGRL